MNHGNQKFMFFCFGEFCGTCETFRWFSWQFSLKIPEGAVAPKRRRGRQALQKRQKPSRPRRSSRLGWSIDCCGFRCFNDDWDGLVGMQTQTNINIAFEKKHSWRSFNSSDWEQITTKKKRILPFFWLVSTLLGKKAKLEALEKLRKLQSVEPKEARAKEWRALYGSQLWFFFFLEDTNLCLWWDMRILL